ncbi:AGE family epimerase/isomerase [Phenylobacterium sp.]|uniref:AGE family epimerase/isomerase n=1 Tax=Phenylobacterium sp. TaxID=1871053 RepID=UPI0035B2B1C9
MSHAIETAASAGAGLRRWLTQAALPLWSSAGWDAERGIFQEALTRDGAPTGLLRRARVQARQIWVFATVARLTQDTRLAALARQGYEGYLHRYAAPNGLFIMALHADETTADGRTPLYEQAFSLLAMAAMQALDGGCDARADALLRSLEALRHGGGGWRELGDQPFQANAHMHLFEAALDWEALDPEGWRETADEIASLALRRFFDPQASVVQEFFTPDWRPLGPEEGGLIEPGHQFEWAWLLDRWGRRRGSEAAIAAAHRLYAAGRRGVDARNVVVGSVWPDFRVRDPVARFWAQAERLRADVVFGAEADVVASASSLARYLATPVAGAFHDKLDAAGGFLEEPAPATSLYHALGAVLALRSEGAAADLGTTSELRGPAPARPRPCGRGD